MAFKGRREPPRRQRAAVEVRIRRCCSNRMAYPATRQCKAPRRPEREHAAHQPSSICHAMRHLPLRKGQRAAKLAVRHITRAWSPSTSPARRTTRLHSARCRSPCRLKARLAITPRTGRDRCRQAMWWEASRLGAAASATACTPSRLLLYPPFRSDIFHSILVPSIHSRPFFHFHPFIPFLPFIYSCPPPSTPFHSIPHLRPTPRAGGVLRAGVESPPPAGGGERVPQARRRPHPPLWCGGPADLGGDARAAGHSRMRGSGGLA